MDYVTNEMNHSRYKGQPTFNFDWYVCPDCGAVAWHSGGMHIKNGPMMGKYQVWEWEPVHWCTGLVWEQEPNPTSRRIDMFARDFKQGFAAWGNELDRYVELRGQVSGGAEYAQQVSALGKKKGKERRNNNMPIVEMGDGKDHVVGMLMEAYDTLTDVVYKDLPGIKFPLAELEALINAIDDMPDQVEVD